MASDNKEEELFLKSLNVERVFEIMERTDYFFIYNIRLCMEHSEIDGGVYLSELAEQMDMSVTDASKAVKNMEDYHKSQQQKIMQAVKQSSSTTSQNAGNKNNKFHENNT